MPMDLKELNDAVQTTFSEMKAHVDRQQAEIKKYGESTGETTATIEKQNTRLQELEDEIKALRAEKDRPMRGAPGEGYGPTSAKERLDAEKREKYDLFFRWARLGVAEMPDSERKSFRELYSVKRGSDLDERQITVTVDSREAKALSIGDETAGGYLAPPEFVQDIIKGVQLISPIRPLAQVRTTSRRSVQYPVRSGVFAARWVAETATRSETAGLTYALEEIPNHELYADVLVSDQDLEDAVFNLEQEILDNCTEQFAKAEGTAFVSGTAVGQPEGILTNANITADAQTSSASGNLTATGLLTIWQNLKTVYVKNATWLLNRASIGQIRALVDGQGRFLWEPGLADGTPPNLLGSPYVEVPDLPNTPTSSGTTYPVVYGNIKRGYLIVDRINVVVRRLQEKYAESGQIAYLVRKRVGGQVVLPEAIRKLGAVHT